MKKIILMTIIIISFASAKITGVENGIKYNILQGKTGNIIKLKSELSKISKSTSLSSDKKALKIALRIAAKETKKAGYNYFVILNRDVNNVNGFPINRVNDLARYISLRKRDSNYYTSGRIKNSGLIVYGKVTLKYKPISSKQFKGSFLTVWSVKQTLKDTK